VLRRLFLGLLVLSLIACGGDDDSADSINVFAASSLTDAFTALGEQFEAANPGSEIEFNFGSSSDLVTQIDEGAPVDVFASADEANMQKVADESVVFARNRLAIAVEPGNPLGIEGLEDLADADVKVVLCASEAPCGKYADQILESAGVEVTPVSREANVRDTLGKIGEADAAIVYVTDVRANDAIEAIEIPDDQNVITTLPIVALDDSEIADAFVDYVTSADGQAILTEDFGFLAP
jgi:molybdate transport system substrate-binding protein